MTKLQVDSMRFGPWSFYRTLGVDVTWLRLQRATTLLGAARGSIGDIAAAVGYDNAFAFSTAFKRLHGLPPSVWRK